MLVFQGPECGKSLTWAPQQRIAPDNVFCSLDPSPMCNRLVVLISERSHIHSSILCRDSRIHMLLLGPEHHDSANVGTAALDRTL